MTDDEREEGSLVAIAGGTLVDGKATCKCGGRLYRFSPAGIDGQVSCGECKSIWDEWPPCGRDFTHLLCQKYNCGTHVGRWCDLCYGESRSPEGDAHSMAGLSREDDVWLIRCACGWSDSFSTCSEAGAEMDYHLASESGWELCNQPPSSIRPRQPRYDDVYRQGREWLDGEVVEQRAKGGGCYVVEKSVTLADMTPDAPLQPQRSIVAEKAILIAEALMNGSGVDGEVHQVLLSLLPDLDPFWPRWIVYLQRREAGSQGGCGLVE